MGEGGWVKRVKGVSEGGNGAETGERRGTGEQDRGSVERGTGTGSTQHGE